MNKLIFITNKIPNSGISLLQDNGFEVDMNETGKTLTKQELISVLNKKPYSGLISSLVDKIDEEVVENCPNIKVVSNYTIGFDNLDLEALTKNNITVFNSPSNIAVRTVAEHTLGLMLTLSRRILEGDSFVRNQKYEGFSAMNLLGSVLLGKTLGIIGTGRIGLETAKIANAFGMNIIYFDRNRNEFLDQNLKAVFMETVDEVLSSSDFVSLHVPLNESTRHLINKEKLSLMKKDAFLINTSRGQVIDEEALVDALVNQSIKGAGLDVFEFEPNVNPKLKELKNVILTPHIASASIEAREEMSKISAQNIIDFFEGKELKNKLN